MEGRAQPTEVTTEAADDRKEDVSLDPGLDAQSKETFVVQMPRDQVYRVPPPEHAKIVENFQKLPNEKKGCTLSWCCWIFVVISILGIAIGIYLVVSNSLFRPKSPIFHVGSIQAKNLESKKGSLPPSFDVVMAVSNPNSGIYALYKDGGNSSLIFKNVRIGGGEFAQVSQDGLESIDVNLKLDGTKDVSSKEINTSLNDTHPKALILKIDVTIEMKNWVKSMSKDMKVKCNLNVKSFGKNQAEILSENCHTDFE